MTATRKLAAILAADVAGYSRLMGADEEGTLARLRVWVERLLAANPDTTVSSMRLHYGVFMKKPGCLEAYLDGLRKAGLPE